MNRKYHFRPWSIRLGKRDLFSARFKKAMAAKDNNWQMRFKKTDEDDNNWQMRFKKTDDDNNNDGDWKIRFKKDQPK